MSNIKWSIDQSKKIYNIAEWSAGYFDINPAGHLIACPSRDGQQPGIDLVEMTARIQESGLRLPVLVRFPDILQDRLKHLQAAFAQAQQACQYAGEYTALYPIKVNQQRQVINNLLTQGKNHFGLEAGSKPELMAVLASCKDKTRTIVCNGYKDREFIRLALMGQKLGHQVFIIIEKLSEIDSILEESQKLLITPQLGVRVRLSSISKGKWQNSGGEKSKFGLTVPQLLQLIEKLKSNDSISTLQVMHFHLGSQIANIRDIQRSMGECARMYAELHHLGVPIAWVDVGGGLGVDYEGTNSRSFCSMNYSVEEYARQVVSALAEICAQKKLPHPNILTESGRALSAHHAMLITNLVDVEQPQIEKTEFHFDGTAHAVLQHLALNAQALHSRNVLEIYHEICHGLNEAQIMFSHGSLNLKERALAEQIYLQTCARIQTILQSEVSSRAQQEVLDELNEKLADKYFVNFSVFQSVPDVWAIDQIFPVLPLNKLTLAPTRRGVLHDLACDSDGCLDYYIEGQNVTTTLPLVPWDRHEPYFLGIFLVGAYQEILGDIHNLFGDTDSVHVALNDDGTYRLEEPIRGDNIADVLRYVQFDSEQMLASYAMQAQRAGLSSSDQETLMNEFSALMKSYTYLSL